MPTGYINIYYIYAQTCLLINRYETFYPRCLSLEIQASSDFTWSRAVKILFISLQYLSILFLDFSATNFYLSIYFSNFPLSICSCWIIIFNSLAFNTAACLLSDFIIIRYFYLLISRVNLTLFWYRSSIFAIKLISGLENSRNLLDSQLKVELTRINSAYRFFPILY